MSFKVSFLLYCKERIHFDKNCTTFEIKSTKVLDDKPHINISNIRIHTKLSSQYNKVESFKQYKKVFDEFSIYFSMCDEISNGQYALNTTVTSSHSYRQYVSSTARTFVRMILTHAQTYCVENSATTKAYTSRSSWCV